MTAYKLARAQTGVHGHDWPLFLRTKNAYTAVLLVCCALPPFSTVYMREELVHGYLQTRVLCPPSVPNCAESAGAWLQT